MKFSYRIVAAVGLISLQTLVWSAPLDNNSDITQQNSMPSLASTHSKKLLPFLALNYSVAVSPAARLTSNYAVGEGNFSFADQKQSGLLGIYGGTAGLEIPLSIRNTSLAWQVGLSFQQFAQRAVSGNAVQGISGTASLNHYTYNYNINSNEILVNNRLVFNYRRYFHPYADFALGQATNRTSNYQASPQDTSADLPVLFANKTTNGLAYQLGLGVEADVAKNLRVGVGYRFSDLGKVSLGEGNIAGTVGLYTGGHLSRQLYDQLVSAELIYYIPV